MKLSNKLTIFNSKTFLKIILIFTTYFTLISKNKIGLFILKNIKILIYHKKNNIFF